MTVEGTPTSQGDHSGRYTGAEALGAGTGLMELNECRVTRILKTQGDMMEFKVGQIWLDRMGTAQTVTRIVPDSEWPVAAGSWTYRPDGRWSSEPGADSPFDLVTLLDDTSAKVYAWRKENNFPGGYVVTRDGHIVGWCIDLTKPGAWVPGCVAYGSQFKQYVAAGGDATNGATHWKEVKNGGS